MSQCRKWIYVGFLPIVLQTISTPPTAAATQVAKGKSAIESLPLPTKNGYYYFRGRQDPRKVELGRLLFFDKLLSGNMNTSCATCHHPLADTGDGLSLPVGEGGRGLGVTRDTGRGRNQIHERVPRNAPPIFNLGAKQFRRMFHDGRVEKDPSQPSGFRSPAGPFLPQDLDNVLAAQAMFPVTSATEMAGQAGENDVADAAASNDVLLVWELLARRLRAIPEYVDLFFEVFPELPSAQAISFTHAANAIAAFEAVAWRADDSPFDRFLRGDKRALSRAAKRGMKLFYGSIGCSSCHAGVFQTDHKFHAVAMPQIGPGKGDGPDGRDDFGRERVTLSPFDRFRFRTPPLRNVAITGPWGHDGAYNTLRAVVEHHFDPLQALADYDISQASLPARDDLDAVDSVAHADVARRSAIAEACELERKHVSVAATDDILAFLHALTDPTSLDLRRDVPARVPSGLPLAE
ncbi:MAG: cytochrome-c peroxidase [Acidobacteriota bacterium]|nr:cytochrome-c peroxidase [Acidobacteriota bacterium]